MAINLRGVRESGDVLRDPDLRASWSAILGMCAFGLRPAGRRRRCRRSRAPTSTSSPAPGYDGRSPRWRWSFLLARAFSSGCAALTGVEAISNGVPAFRKPKSKNAATTLLLLGTIAITMLLSIIVLANQMGLKYVDPTTSTG